MNNKIKDVSLNALGPFIILLADYRYWLFLGFILSIATLFSSIILLTISGWFLVSTSLAGISGLTIFVYNFSQPVVAIAIFSIIRTLGRWLERIANHEVTFRLIAKYRVWLFAGVAPLSDRQRRFYHGGTLLNLITRDTDSLDNFYIRLLLPVSVSLLLMLIISAIAISFLSSLALPFAILFISSFIVSPILAWNLGQKIAPLSQRYQRKLRVDLLELIDGLELFSLRYNIWKKYRQQALDNSKKLLFVNWQLHKKSTLISNCLSALIGLMALLTLALMSYSDLNGIWIASGVILILACGELLSMLPGAWLKLPGTCDSANNLTKLHDSVAEISYPQITDKTPIDNSLTICNVSFAYDKGVNVLHKINLSIKAGTHCLIQGNSGGGKTTLIKLLTRQLAKQKGEILLGGVDITDFSAGDLRQRIAYAPQDTYLFTDTIANNLRLANVSASDEDLRQVLHTVGLSEFINSLPQNLETWTDEDGANLSGGQQRRLGIARALLVDADLIILDEPTEGLDLVSEARLIADVSKYVHGKTLLWVSHRKTNINSFTSVVTLSEGHIKII